jgi:MYXO-CTERM domain-containing protein
VCPLDDDGCQIGARGQTAAWLLFVPVIGLLVVRRRRR